ncbi:MAG: GNAT family N-acetyltransferase [Candidatus Saccharicenans sp.]|jgi:GNAT superfamily N-acetyltransferase|nr:GNAT family N-acetyltransferase [Candidatus Saccharicenans sp.]MDH7492533.1 hypothetical protein [Candidatus Saccharicenans sp.]
MFNGISIEPFRGDLEALEKMAHRAWRDEYGMASFPNLYRPDFVRYLLEIAADPKHFVAAYRGDEILAFLGNIPRTFHYQGKNYRAILSCLLVSRQEYARQGLAQAVIKEAVRINLEIAHYDFALLYLESGHRSSRLIEKFRAEGQPLQFLKKMSVLGRVLELDRVAYSEGLKCWEKAAIKIWGAHRLPKPDLGRDLVLEEFQESDLPAAMNLLNQYAGKVELARVWLGLEELKKEILYPGVSSTLAIKKEGRLVALLNYLEHEHLGQSPERWAWLNHLYLDSLEPAEKIQVINRFLLHLFSRGIVGVVEWSKGYYSQGFLYRSHFFPYFRHVNLLAWVFQPELVFRPVKGVYEVQI